MIKISCDTPNKENINTQFLQVSGWAFSDTKVREIKIFMNDKHTGNAIHGSFRQDVKNAYPNIPNSEHSGYWYDINLENFQKGQHVLKIEAISTDNEHITITKKIIIETFDDNEFNYLPEFKKSQNFAEKHENIHEGYQRSCGLRWGDLKEKIWKDHLFTSAYKLVEDKIIMSNDRLCNLYLILKYFLRKIPQGNIIEFGSYKGGSAMFMAYVCSKLHPDIKIYALDTYEGMPDTDKSIDIHSQNDFKDINLKEIIDFSKSIGLNNIEFIKGLFQDTSQNVLKKAEKIALAHIDCDIYSAVAYSYNIVKKFMVKGGYIIFDDATEASCLGATRAVEDFVIKKDKLNSEQIYPHFVFRKK